MRQKRPHAMTWHELMQELVGAVVPLLMASEAVQVPSRVVKLDAELKRRSRGNAEERCYCEECWIDVDADEPF